LSSTIAGQWTLPWSFPSAGVVSIYAVYSPSSGNLSSSTGSANLYVRQDTTTTTLTSNANPSLVGQPVTFTATVAVALPGASTPSGTMTFKDGSTVLISGVPVTNGVASYTLSTLAQGTNAIRAVYSGDTNETTSTSAALSEMIQSATTVGLTSSSLSATAGTVTYTATLTVVVPGTGTPTGTVSFYYLGSGGPVLIGTAVVGAGVAKLKPTATTLPASSYAIYAVYNGDTTHKGSTSNTINESLS
jgi:hypothetical protein